MVCCLSTNPTEQRMRCRLKTFNPMEKEINQLLADSISTGGTSNNSLDFNAMY